MIRSMTGFGTADGAVGAAHVSIEVRSVNHRFFNPSIKLPSSLSRWEPEVREVLRRSITRGHVTVMARVERARGADDAIDEGRFASYVQRLRDLREKYDLEGPIDLATVLRLPELSEGAHRMEVVAKNRYLEVDGRPVAVEMDLDRPIPPWIWTA